MLQGRVLVDLDEQLEIESSLPHGHVAAVLGMLRELDLERLLSRERCRERDLVVAMICQLVIAPASKLSMTRRFRQTTLAEELALGEVTEPELMAAMDWLAGRQERIERTLARRHLVDGGFVLYDLSSSYFEGRCCPLAALGHNRDGKTGKLQVNWGLVCSPDGRPVSVQVHPGNTADPSTVPGVIDTVRERFGIERVILVGDRAMITDAHATDAQRARRRVRLRPEDCADPQADRLWRAATLAVRPEQPRRDHQRRVPRRAAGGVPQPTPRRRARPQARGPAGRDRTRARQGQAHGRRTPRTLRNADAGKIGERAGRVINKYKVAKHFELQIADGSFSYERKTSRSRRRPRSTGSTSSEPPAPMTPSPPRPSSASTNSSSWPSAPTARSRTRSTSARSATTSKQRVAVRTSSCSCSPTTCCFELQARLAPMLFTDDTPLAPADPVAPARRSPAANTKAGRAPHPRRAARLQPHRPHRRTRHHLPQPTPHRRQRTTPSRASPTPTPSRPKRSNSSTSSSPRSQSQTSSRTPNPAPTRGIRHLNTKNFRLDPPTR